MVKDMVSGEKDAMVAYEDFMKESNDATRTRQKGITDRRARIGKLEQFKTDTQELLDQILEEKATLRQHDIDLHGVEGCDFLFKNYETRVVERQEEIDSLKQADAVITEMVGSSGLAEQQAKKKEMEEKIAASGIAAGPPAGEEEEEPIKVGGSTMKSEPEGVDITGPGGEHGLLK